MRNNEGSIYIYIDRWLNDVERSCRVNSIDSSLSVGPSAKKKKKRK